MRRCLKAGFSWLTLVGCLLFSVSLPLAAAQTDGGAISQGFPTNEQIVVPGELMSLNNTNDRTVVPSSSDNPERVAGVVGVKSVVEISGDAKQVQLVMSGTTYTLVSTINGDIKAGDKITASPIKGVGMKATESVQIVGVAQDDFSAAQQIKEHQTSDKNGREVTVKTGLIPVQINITSYVAPVNQEGFLPAFLQQTANIVAGKDVSPIRVIVATVVLAIGFIGIVVLLYTSVRSSIASIGRNPLSEVAVQKSLLGVGLFALGILLFTLIVIFLILRT